MINIAIRPLIVIGAFLFGTVTISAQVETITTDGRLSYDFNRPDQFIPIDATPGHPVKVAWVHQQPSFNYRFYYSVRSGENNWEAHPVAVNSNDRVNLWSGRDGRTFIYIDYGWQYFESGDSLVLRYGDTYDVMDSLGCFHFIFRDIDGPHFIFSSDTLTSWIFGNTVSADWRQIGVAISPDRGLAAATFVDYNILEKYISPAGQQLDTLNPVISVFEYGADDYTIDNNGMIYIAYSVLGDSTWKERYVWTERHGYRYLHPLYDSEFNGPQAQLAFAPARNLVFLLESNIYAEYDSMNISYSTDDGDTWILSDIHPIGGNGSTPRLAFDTLYIAAQLTDEYDVIFQKVAIDDVVNGMAINDKPAPIPYLYLSQNYPNPFNSSTNIIFETPPDTKANLAIYDLSGRKIITLLNGKASGQKSVVWNGKNNYGVNVASGVYLYRLSIEGQGSVTRQMILLR